MSLIEIILAKIDCDEGKMISMYYIYIVLCADNTLYTGITTELLRRVDEHNSSDKGAKYTKIRRPVTLVYSEPATNRSVASKKEYAIKRFSRKKKLELIQNFNLTHKE